MSDGGPNIFALLQGLMRTQAIYVASELGVADVLADGPLPLEELASRVGADPDSLHRYLRALATEGVFAQPEPGTWANTDGSEQLRDPAQRDIAHFYGTLWYRAFGESLHAVRTGEPAFPKALGGEWWTWLEQHPGEQARFDRAMRGGNDARVEALDALTWRGDETVVDVGGGLGALLVGLLRRHDGMRGVLFDQEQTAQEAERSIAAEGMSERIQVAAGSFFERVPAGDVHVLSGILHDWDDAPSRAILGQLGERVVILDGILDEEAPDREHAWFDLLMLVMFRGRERTETQWRELLAGAGYRVDRFHERGMIEAVRD